MFTTVKLMSGPGKVDHVLVISKKKKYDGSFFSQQERKYVDDMLQKNKKQITVNQFGRMIFVQAAPETEKELLSELEFYRKAGAQWTARINALGIEKVVIMDAGNADNTLALAEGMALANYQFLKYKSGEKKDVNSLKEIAVAGKKIDKNSVNRLGVVIEATCIARNLVNEPQSYLNATTFGRELSTLAGNAGVKATVFDKKKITELKMGGLLSVNMGSPQPPTFTVLEYKPRNAVNKKPVILVGKGVVFDTGGMSLKPTPNSMDYMKCDMAGGAVVGTSIYAAAKSKLPLYIIGLVPATDNRPDGDAYVPGDVITMMSGKTVEVLNTDAEGRLILADALHYAKRYDPEVVLEFSTLTGSAAATLGHYGIVAMGNAPEPVMNRLRKSADSVHERFAEMPFWDEFNELLKSDIADLKNVGGPNAGAITAGKFLEHFTDYPFVHFDIAGPAFLKSTDSYRGKNATGVGVRLVFNFLCRRAGIKV